MSIDAAFFMVREFHKIMDQPHPDTPTMQSPELLERREAWIDSEQVELREAVTVAQQADAYFDMIYFALGGLVEIGVIPGVGFDAAHAANMAKRWADGTVHKRSDGKIIKPPGWKDPTDIQEADVHRQMIEQPLRAIELDA